MNALTVDRLILDAHGVCFNNPFKPFLTTMARMTHQRPDDVQQRWMKQLRAPAWLGEIDDEDLWRQLTGSLGDTLCWQALLETHYEPGPVAPYLKRWGSAVSIWILSNHRASWLHRRLDRFDMTDRFDRVYVSDEEGFIKPDIRFFERVTGELHDPSRALFIDDQQANIESALEVGMQALRVDHPHLRLEVENRIGLKQISYPMIR